MHEIVWLTSLTPKWADFSLVSFIVIGNTCWIDNFSQRNSRATKENQYSDIFPHLELACDLCPGSWPWILSITARLLTRWSGLTWRSPMVTLSSIYSHRVSHLTGLALHLAEAQAQGVGGAQGERRPVHRAPGEAGVDWAAAGPGPDKSVLVLHWFFL